MNCLLQNILLLLPSIDKYIQNNEMRQQRNTKLLTITIQFYICLLHFFYIFETSLMRIGEEM